MRVIDPGHHFALDSLDGEIKQTLQFVKRCGDKYPGNEEPAYPGATSQEVLRALISRTLYVQNQEFDARNVIALRGLRMALRAFETRAAERRDELDQFFDLVDGGCGLNIEDHPTCPTCGHIACGKHVEKRICKVCGVDRDEQEHSRGCYMVSEDGGGYG